ncbi:MAG: hypothetical protein NXI12_08100 [Alphaproteobacteria bacterium]|nr:hypothetical protein [Alphaproteobacteria bacterium]
MRQWRLDAASVWKTPHSPALFEIDAIKEWAMKGMLIGLAVLAVIIGGGFAALLAMAESGAPEPSEIRIEVDRDVLSDA